MSAFATGEGRWLHSRTGEASTLQEDSWRGRLAPIEEDSTAVGEPFDTPPVYGPPTTTQRIPRTIVVVVVTLLPCLWLCVSWGPIGRAVHTTYLRRFADHEAIRASCLDLLRRHRGTRGRITDADVPETLRSLGKRCSVEVDRDRVVVDVGSFWIDSYGFVAAEEGATGGWLDSGAELIPELVWWDAG